MKIERETAHAAAGGGGEKELFIVSRGHFVIIA
jgi:hypothetical protein